MFLKKGRKEEMNLSKFESTNLITKYGSFTLYVWSLGENEKEPIAIVTKNLDSAKIVTVRIHSECLTGDIFGSLACDCEEQKIYSLKFINKSKNGIFIYDRQEGRGIGLFEKIKALRLQESGLDTYEANIKLGHPHDARNYKMVCNILNFFHINKIRLVTNNPSKILEIRSGGIKVVERIPIVVEPNSYNIRYLKAKKIIGKHLL